MNLEELRARKGFICDMDGVIYHGNRILPGVAEFIQWLHDEDKEYLFLTNNSGYTPRELNQKLARMGLDVPEETRRTALSIARDVHEIKKDYMRIIQGIEQEISAEYDEKQMELKDIFRILEETTHRMSESLGLRLSLDFSCQDNCRFVAASFRTTY